jgi:hypothetical protein
MMGLENIDSPSDSSRINQKFREHFFMLNCPVLSSSSNHEITMKGALFLYWLSDNITPGIKERGAGKCQLILSVTW